MVARMRRLRRGAGLLIVNADDFGWSQPATAAVIECFERGALSSASLMVWMADSARAAQIARDRALPLGLHLNLTVPFRDRSVPREVRELQESFTRELDRTSWSTGAPALEEGDARLAQAVEHQLQEFRERYGEPTHIDGHHHVHVHPAVLAALPRKYPLRPVIHGPNDLGKRGDGRDRSLRARFRAPDDCVSIRRIHPAFEGGAGLQVLDFAQTHVLDVMVHPQFDDEREVLLGEEWLNALASLELGSYRDLARGERR
jgi:hypothetical protein